MDNSLKIAVSNTWKFVVTILGKVTFVVTPANTWKFVLTQAEITPPVLVSAILTDNFTLALTFDKALNEASVPDFVDFVYAQSVTGVDVTGAVVTLTFTSEILYSDTDQIAYVPGSNPLQDLAGNEVIAFSSNVDNSIFPNGSCSDLLLSAATADGFRADWINGSTDETGIVIEYSEDQVTWIPETLAAGTEFKIFTGLDSSQIYYVKVRAIKDTFYSGYTATESITTEGGYPAILEDGNTVGWYLSDDLTTITKDGSDFVSRWNDKLGSGHDLIQATGTNQPKWVDVDGILFDGVDNYLRAVNFTWNQPCEIFIVMKQLTWTLNDIFFDGGALDRGEIYQFNIANKISEYCGGTVKTFVWTLNNYGVLRILFNGAGGHMQIGTGTLQTFTGASNMAGFILGARFNASAFANIQVKEIILRKIADISGDETAIYNYLATKYGI